jgi:hypothetical protein
MSFHSSLACLTQLQINWLKQARKTTSCSMAFLIQSTLGASATASVPVLPRDAWWFQQRVQLAAVFGHLGAHQGQYPDGDAGQWPSRWDHQQCRE